MLDQTFLQENLFKLVAHTLPKRAHTCTFNIFDFNFNRPSRNALGFYMDPKPFEGKVVAYDLENNFMVVKKGRQARFSVLELTYVTSQPKVGKKVKVIPYARHDFNGNRVDGVTTHQEEINGVIYKTSETILGGNDVYLLVQAIHNQELKELILQLEILPAPDGIRKITHLLVDAKATEFKLCDPINDNEIPSISFKANQKEITISYNYGSDAYDFDVIELDRDPIKIEGIYFDQLGEILESLIDDKSWQKIEVIELK